MDDSFLSLQQEVEDALKKVCSALGSLKDECGTLVTTFFPQIWQLIVNQVVSGSVCVCLCLSAHQYKCMSGVLPKMIRVVASQVLDIRKKATRLHLHVVEHFQHVFINMSGGQNCLSGGERWLRPTSSDHCGQNYNTCTYNNLYIHVNVMN